MLLLSVLVVPQAAGACDRFNASGFRFPPTFSFVSQITHLNGVYERDNHMTQFNGVYDHAMVGDVVHVQMVNASRRLDELPGRTARLRIPVPSAVLRGPCAAMSVIRIVGAAVGATELVEVPLTRLSPVGVFVADAPPPDAAHFLVRPASQLAGDGD
eukprot:gene10676-66381_t